MAQEAVHQTGLPFPEEVHDLIIKSRLPWQLLKNRTIKCSALDFSRFACFYGAGVDRDTCAH